MAWFSTPPRKYADKREQSAYYAGYNQGFMGMPRLLHRDWPNAHGAGYWNGVADRDISYFTPSKWGAPKDGRGPWSHFRVWFIQMLWPVYDCADCIGMRDHGCQCDYYGAVAPGVPAEWWRKALRRIRI